MKDGFVKAAVSTPELRVADCLFNEKKIKEKAEKLAEKGARLIVFPEFALTGYTCQDLFLQDTLLDGATEALKQLAVDTAGIKAVVVVGLPLEMQGRLYNVAAVLNQGKILGFVPKSHMPNYGEFYEARQFAPWKGENTTYRFQDGTEVPFGTKIIFENREMREFTFAIELCEDLWVPQPPSGEHAMAGAHLIVNLSASDELTGKASYRRDLVKNQSARTLSGYLYADAGEGESTQDMVFGGHNLIVENGTILEECQPFATEQDLITELDVKRLKNERRRMSTFSLEPRADYERVYFDTGACEETVLTRTFEKTPFVPSGEAARQKRCEEILAIQSMGLAKRLRHTGCKNAVIGLSGGLDSTLALLVTVRAFDRLGLDRKGIWCVTMPCFGTTSRTYDNAVSLAKELGATLKEIRIEEAVQIHFRDIGHDPQVQDVTYENGQARERTQILMDVANQAGGMVIGTGDMSELALGWATYNGDHMSMYGVNCGVPKTLVRHLVRWVAAHPDYEVARGWLLDIVDTPISPELLPADEKGEIVQKTEDLVGPYELHDFFLYHFVRFGCRPAKLHFMACRAFAGKYDAKTVKKWLTVFLRRFFSQQFKRSALPDGPKVGSVSLSPRGDWRMPSDASPAMWIREAESL